MVDVADCPKCGKRTLILQSKEYISRHKPGIQKEIWGKCYSCGWEGRVQ